MQRFDATGYIYLGSFDFLPRVKTSLERSTSENRGLRRGPTFPWSRVEMKHKTKTNSGNSFKRPEPLWYSRACFSSLSRAHRVQAKHPTYIGRSFIFGRRVSHTCDVLLTLLEDVLGLHRKPLWQLWDDSLSFYKRKPTLGSDRKSLEWFTNH